METVLRKATLSKNFVHPELDKRLGDVSICLSTSRWWSTATVRIFWGTPTSTICRNLPNRKENWPGRSSLRNMIEADLADCTVVMPPQLFYTAQLSVWYWKSRLDAESYSTKTEQVDAAWWERTIKPIDLVKINGLLTKSMLLNGTLLTAPILFSESMDRISLRISNI